MIRSARAGYSSTTHSGKTRVSARVIANLIGEPHEYL
jgi:hypothetical protein